MRKILVGLFVGLGIFGLIFGMMITTSGGGLTSQTTSHANAIDLRAVQTFRVPHGGDIEVFDPALQAEFTANGGRVMVERRDGSVYGCDLGPDTTYKLIGDERINGASAAPDGHTTEFPWAYCPSRELAAIALNDGSLRLRDFSGRDTAGQVRQIPAADLGGPIRHLAFDTSFSTTCRLAVVTDTSARVWDLAAGSVREVAPGMPVRNGVALSGALLVTAQGTWDGTTHDTRLEVWRGTDSMVIEPGPGEALGVWNVRLSSDGAYLAADLQRDGNSGVRIWDPSTGEMLWESELSPSYWTRSMAFSPRGEQLAIGDEKGFLRLMSASSGELLVQRDVKAVVSALAYSPDGVRLAGALADERVLIWTLQPAALPL